MRFPLVALALRVRKSSGQVAVAALATLLSVPVTSRIKNQSQRRQRSLMAGEKLLVWKYNSSIVLDANSEEIIKKVMVDMALLQPWTKQHNQ